MESHDRFRDALLRLLQTGTMQEILACRDKEPARVEFRIETTYHIHLTRRHMVLKEREVETVRRHAGGRWRRLAPSVETRHRIVLDRASGAILEAPQLGRRVSDRAG